MTIEELQAKYLEVVGRSTGSDDRRYLIWKIREAEKGRINVGPRKTRARDGERSADVTFRSWEHYEDVPPLVGPFSAFVTVQRGCDYRCTFCIVPMTRGPERSRMLADVVREVTEGFYADRNMALGHGEVMPDPDMVISLRKVTRRASERIARRAFELAMTRGRHVTAVHKANVLKLGDGLFLQAVRAVAADFPEVTLDDRHIDAMAALLVREPARFDVIVTNNLFGDILTDLGAALQGGLGMAASGNIHPGKVSLFEPVHGSAPQFAGKNTSNPIAAILTSAMMLDFLGFKDAASGIESAVERAVRAGQTTKDTGGALLTTEAGEAIRTHLRGLRD